MSVEVVHRARALVGEGPFWDGHLLHWVDIEAGEIHRLDPATGHDTALTVAGRVGCAVPAGDGWIAGLRDRVALVAADGTVRSSTLVPMPGATYRFNDGACDERGRYWTGTMDEAGALGACSLYRVDADLTVTEVLDGVSLSNGIAWSPDGRLMYYADSDAGSVDVFDFDADAGTIGNRRSFHSSQTGKPDGLCVDADGCVWLALWGGGAVVRLTPKGDVDRRVDLPVTQVTSCAFGPATTLFVTTAATGGAREELAGSIFASNVRVEGAAVHRFAGGVS